MKPSHFVIAFITLCAACSPNTETTEAPPPPEPSGQEQIESFLQPSLIIKGDDYSNWSLDERRAFYGVPSASVAIAKDGEIEWAAGYGDGIDADNCCRITQNNCCENGYDNPGGTLVNFNDRALFQWHWQINAGAAHT